MAVPVNKLRNYRHARSEFGLGANGPYPLMVSVHTNFEFMFNDVKLCIREANKRYRDRVAKHPVVKRDLLIFLTIEEVFGVHRTDIIAQNRDGALARIRGLLYSILSRHGMPSNDIGNRMHRLHTTIDHSIDLVKELVDEALRDDF